MSKFDLVPFLQHLENGHFGVQDMFVVVVVLVVLVLVLVLTTFYTSDFGTS